MDWELEDVEATAAANARSFFVPSLKNRQSKEVGDSVRLHFVLLADGKGLPRAERMWVEITGVGPSIGTYKGILTNAPAYIRSIRLGDTVEFEARHIAQILIKHDHPEWLPCGELSALVSAMVLDDNQAVRFAYREEADDEQDSGWRLFSGQESDKYTDDAKHIRTCNVYWLVDFDPTLKEILRADVGSVFERDGSGLPWRPVTDWVTPRD
jgi:hypothetical protein